MASGFELAKCGVNRAECVLFRLSQQREVREAQHLRCSPGAKATDYYRLSIALGGQVLFLHLRRSQFINLMSGRLTCRQSWLSTSLHCQKHCAAASRFQALFHGSNCALGISLISRLSSSPQCSRIVYHALVGYLMGD